MTESILKELVGGFITFKEKLVLVVIFFYTS